MDLARPAPPKPLRRDPAAPAVLAASLLLHAAVVTPFAWSPHSAAARPPAETPVEVVQEPPEATKPPKPPPATHPPQPKQIAREEPKRARARPEARAEPKSNAAKAAEAVAKPPRDSVAQRMEQLIGPMPAMALPSLTARGDNPLDDAVPYRQLVLSRVAAQKREGRHEGVPGHVVVSFLVGDRGEVVSCDVREKSVDPGLDAEAIAMVRRGAPYPAPPPGAERHFTFGLRFQAL